MKEFCQKLSSHIIYALYNHQNKKSTLPWRYKLILIFIYFCIIESDIYCQNNLNFGKQGTAKLKLLKEVQIPVDIIFGSEYGLIENKNTLLILTMEGIKFYDIDKEVFYRDIKYPEKNIRFNSIRVINSKNILLGSQMPYLFYIIDLQGNVIMKHGFSAEKEGRYSNSVPYLDFSVVREINGYIYLAGSIITTMPIEERISPLIRLNINSGKTEYLLSYPNEYKNNRGGMQNNYNYVCTNNKSQVIISFPASNDLFVYDVASKRLMRKNAGSSKIRALVSSNISETDVVKVKEQYNKYFFTTPSYEQVVFDNYRELYLRVAMHPNMDYGRSNSFSKPKTLIFLDKNFNFIGEDELENDVVNIFAYSKGMVAIGMDTGQKRKILRKYEIDL